MTGDPRTVWRKNDVSSEAQAVTGPVAEGQTVRMGETSPAEPATAAPVVELYWRPGCGFCSSLRRKLQKRGIETTEHNIWEEPEAAARVRSVARGSETVPTVFIGEWSAVNPSAADVQRQLDARH